MYTALVAGATGLIGSQLLTLLKDDPHYQRIVVLSRKPLETNSKKIHVELINETLVLKDDWFKGVHAVFCCLGTTMKKAGSKEAFRSIDYEFPKKLGELSAANKVHRFLMVTAMGSDKKSMFFYNRVKGEVEEVLLSLNLERLDIFRPSMLYGPRKEKRNMEAIAIVITRILGFLLPPAYKSIESLRVAKAMLHYSKQEEKGIFFHPSDELQKFR